MTITARTAEQIRDEWLLQLAPGGAAWPKTRESNLSALMMAFATVRADIEADLAALALEISPGTSTLLLSDYHAVLGPDPAGRDAGTMSTEALQTLLQQRWVSPGGQSIAFYAQLAATYGIEIAIEEPEPPVWGAFAWGAVQFAQPTLRYVWIVHMPAPDTGLQKAIALNAPADTAVFFMVNGIYV
ncbi:MAG: putative phage tail protein [Gluconacetobacter sp.]